MNIKVKKGDVIWSYLSIITSLCSNIVIIPIVMCYLSGEMLGLWYVFGGIGGIAYLFDFGFTATFARNITYCWSGAKCFQKQGGIKAECNEPDFQVMNVILYVCRRVYMIIAVIILILMLSVGTLYVYHIASHLDVKIVIIAWSLYSLGVFLNMYYNYYDSFLRGIGAVKQASKNRTIAKIVQIVLMAVLLMLGQSIIGISIAYIIFGCLFRVLSKHSFYNYEGLGEKLQMYKTRISKKQFKDMFHTIWFNAWREGLVQLSFYCMEQVSVIICSIYLTLTETGIYSLGLQIATAVSTIAVALYSTYQPSLQSAFIRHDKEKMITCMSVIVASFILFLFLGIVGTIFIGLPILRLVKPEFVVSISVMIGIFANQFILKLRNCYSSYFSCTNRIIYMPSFILSAILCIVLSMLFTGIFKLGVWGLILAQITSQVIFNLWYWPYKAHIELNISFVNLLRIGYSTLYAKTLKRTRWRN